MKKSFLLKTEVLPAELPLNFTNKNLFKIEKDFTDFTTYTIPYTFEVFKPNSVSKRLISLPHPIAQLQMSNFIDSFKFNITSFCSLSPYSIRSPYKINSININSVKRKSQQIKYDNEQFFNSEDKVVFKISHNDIIREYSHFFKYKKYSFLIQFLNSPIYHRSKSKYKNVMKLDIQNFFGSIYTHSLEWAVSGDKYTIKKNGSFHRDSSNFLKALDSVCQNINYKETNGILVGPEFSRVISEILLTRIDLNIFKDLHRAGLKYNNDYVIYRYVDDYFIFFNDSIGNDREKIKEVITHNLREYKLSLNDSKYMTNNSQSIIEDDSIIKLKKARDYFSEKFNGSTSFNNRMKNVSNFLIEFDKLTIEYPQKKQRLVRYALKSLNEFITLSLGERDRKLIFELALYVFNYSPEYYSSRLLYTFFFKYREAIKAESQDEKFLEKLDEDIFHFMIKSLKQNSNQFSSIYELLIAMKFLDKKISPSILCSLIENHKHDYFSICAIAIYILKNDGKVSKQYLIVLKKVMATLQTFIENYIKKSPHNYQDAIYFYLINDFYHYPGFKNNPLCKRFFKLIRTEHEQIKKDMKKDMRVDFSSEVDSLLENSYFNWLCNFNWFFKQSILKSENISNNTLSNDY